MPLKTLTAVAAAFAGALFADTITINPGAGAETNVTVRIAGADEVAANTGATGGGIVRLQNRSNAYTGRTSVNSGTLAFQSGDAKSGYSDLGATAGVTLGAATLRYDGPAGGTLGAEVVNNFAAKAKTACVLDVRNDLRVTENWTQHYGTFVKTGPGTVYFSGKGNFFGGTASTDTADTLNDTSHKLTFNANGDGPTVGVRGGFVLAEGTMVIDGDETTTNYLNNSTAVGAIGTWTVDSGREKSAVLEIRGGNNFIRKALVPGYHNGNSTTGGEGVSSGLRVLGGYTLVGSGFKANDETIFVGNSATPKGYVQNSHPFIEVLGGKLDISKNLQLGNQGGVHTRLLVAGDGALELNQYIGNGYSGNLPGNPSSNSVTIAGNGSVKAWYIEMFTAATNSVCDVKILDNGTFRWGYDANNGIFKQASKTTGKVYVLMDGGMMYNTLTSAKAVNVFDTKLDRVSIGTRGARFSAEFNKQTLYYNLPLVYSNTVPGVARQPLQFLARGEAEGEDIRCLHYADANFAWDGPVRIGRYAYLYLHESATLGPDADVVQCRDARLLCNTANRTFRNYQIGEEGVTGSSATVFLTTATSLRVTGKLTVASNTGLHVYMRPSAGATWTTGGISDFTTPGVYDVLTVPASSRAELEKLPTSYASAENCNSAFRIVGNADGTCTLQLVIAKVDTTSGTVESSDLSGHTDPSQLRLSGGTLRYTGDGGSTVGFTIDAMGAVLRTEAPLTVTDGIVTECGSLIKTGPSTLTLAAGGAFTVGNAYNGWSTNQADNLIGLNGESPKAGFYGFCIREGRVVVASRDVFANNMNVGSNPALTGIPAELVINGGRVETGKSFYLASSVEGVTNLVEINDGGVLKVGSYLRPGVMPVPEGAAAVPGRLVVNDGGRLELGTSDSHFYNADATYANNEIEMFVNAGGTVALTEQSLLSVEQSPYRGVLHLDGGRVSYAVTNATGAVEYFARYADVFVGGNGAVFDMTERTEGGAPLWGNDLHIAGHWHKEPSLGDAPVGDVVFKGRGIHYIGGSFACDFDVRFVVTDGAHLMVYPGVTGNVRALVNPGCGLRPYQTEKYAAHFQDLTLGADGAVEPVRLETGTANKKSMAGQISYVVSNDLQVLSPVVFSARRGWPTSDVAIDAGTYTALVFRASCDAAVAAAWFSLDPAIEGFAATFTKEPVTEGDYAGWMAIVAKVAKSSAAPVRPAAQRWTATSAGGAWADAANWQDGVKPVDRAVFGAPEKDEVPVAVNEAVELVGLEFEGGDPSKGYAFAGAGPLAIYSRDTTSGARPIDLGLTGARFGLPLAVSGTVEIGNRTPAVAELANGLTGDGAVFVNGSVAKDFSGDRGKNGETRLADCPGFTGTLTVRSGRLEVETLGWVTGTNQVTIAGGTLRYTGSGETVPGINLAPDSTYAAVLEVVNDLTLESVSEIGGSGAVMKTGAGELRFKGNRSFVCGKNNVHEAPSDDVSEILPNGDGPTKTFLNFSVVDGRVVVGTKDDPEDAPTVEVSSQIGVGMYQGGGVSPELVLNNGSITTRKNNLAIGFYDQKGKGERFPRVVVNGGLLDLNRELQLAVGGASQLASPSLTVNGGEVNVHTNVVMGHSVSTALPGATSTVTLNGGRMVVGNNFYVCYAYDSKNKKNRTTDGYLTLNGGELEVGQDISLCRNEVATGRLTLNEGATMAVGNLTARCRGGTAVFNGGTWFPLGSNGVATVLSDPHSDYLVSTKGVTISTARAAAGIYTIAAPLKHDPDGAATDGGLVKTGAGMLVISPNCTFNGPVEVREGCLVRGAATVAGGNVRIDGSFVGGSALMRMHDLTLAAGSVIDCKGVTPGRWSDGLVVVDGDLSAEGRVCVDFGRTSANPLKLGERYPLAVVNGAVRGNLRLKALNAGDNLQLDAVFEDGVLYAEVAIHGTVLIVK